jgi:hypothetical protein
MKVLFEAKCKTREGIIAALRLAIKHVQEFNRTGDLNVGDHVGSGPASFDYVMKWQKAPVLEHEGLGGNVVLIDTEKAESGKKT